MSLIDNMMDNCVIMNAAKVADGEGGFDVEWSEGAPIRAAITHDTSISARVAESNNVTSTFTITTDKSVKLDYHDVIKRLKDGRIFRITSEVGDSESPDVSTLNIAQYTAEKWELTK